MNITPAQGNDEAQEILEALRQIQDSEELRTEADGPRVRYEPSGTVRDRAPRGRLRNRGATGCAGPRADRWLVEQLGTQVTG